MIIHRTNRDINRCRRKYGEAWKRYEKEVPYLFIPVCSQILTQIRFAANKFVVCHLDGLVSMRKWPIWPILCCLHQMISHFVALAIFAFVPEARQQLPFSLFALHIFFIMSFLFIGLRLDGWVFHAQYLLSLIAKVILFLIFLGAELIAFIFISSGLISCFQKERFTNSNPR